MSFPWGSIAITVPISRTIDMLAMPDDWVGKAGNGGRERRETATHELGHNLGLPDEYARKEHTAAFKNRDLAASTNRGQSWSLMSWEERFPQMTVVEKMMLGWIKSQHVRNLSFATLGPVDTDLVLHASDEYPPPANQYAAVEVRISDGINYYFEYRREDPSETSDEDIPADNTVFGVHCWSGTEPKDHRNILRLQDDSDNDKAEFQAGDDYREADTSDPAYPNDFLMKVLSTGTDSAKIHITYGDKKPDPQIRPWAPSTNWKSPDLKVTNARNQADARFPTSRGRTTTTASLPRCATRGPARTRAVSAWTSSSRTTRSEADGRRRWGRTSTTFPRGHRSRSRPRSPGCPRPCR